jgi:hypothetical protein
MTRRVLVLSAGLSLLLSARGSGQDNPAEFRSAFEEAVKAAEKGKELVKSPVRKSKKR